MRRIRSGCCARAATGHAAAAPTNEMKVRRLMKTPQVDGPTYHVGEAKSRCAAQQNWTPIDRSGSINGSYRSEVLSIVVRSALQSGSQLLDFR
jgi:hypothetical protein